jgi:lipoprotein NlpD
VRYARAIAAVCLGVTINAMSGCAASPANASEAYTVRPQDTLYSIAWRHNVDYRELARWNHIGPDYKLKVGQVLMLRPGHSAPAAAAPTPEPRSRGAPRANSSSVPHGPVPDAPVAGIKWVWPTQRTAPPRAVPGGGILVFGQLGQDVRAAAPGRVVYTGSGIRGYGNLIIVKHGDNWLSSYAHNREMLVHEGQEVSMGQIIAHMGTAAHQVSALYFEIRLNGKPVDPLRYLPAPQ